MDSFFCLTPVDLKPTLRAMGFQAMFAYWCRHHCPVNRRWPHPIHVVEDDDVGRDDEGLDAVASSLCSSQRRWHHRADLLWID